MSSWLIDDGYTLSKTVPDSRGFFPAFRFSYRPALHRDKRAFAAGLRAGGETQAKTEFDLIRRHLIDFDGHPIASVQVEKLASPVVETIVEAILSYDLEREVADSKN